MSVGRQRIAISPRLYSEVFWALGWLQQQIQSDIHHHPLDPALQKVVRLQRDLQADMTLIEEEPDPPVNPGIPEMTLAEALEWVSASVRGCACTGSPDSLPYCWCERRQYQALLLIRRANG